MTFRQALKACKKVGCAHAEGDALRAMHANLVNGLHGGDASIYYSHLLTVSDEEIVNEARKLLRDRATAWDILIGIKP